MKNSFKDVNRVTDQPQFAIKFANVVFLLAVFCFILIAILAVYKAYKSYYIYDYSIFILFSVISAILLGLGLRLSNYLKINLSLLIFSVAITVYAFETYLEFVPEKTQSIKIQAKQFGVPFDSRTKMEVLNNLNETGNEGYPNITPHRFTKSNGLGTNKGRIYPLGGIPNVTTVDCNESGYWSIFEADEHGFNNPKGLYQRNKIEIFLTGDSMAEGACVNSDESITAVIRKLGFTAINIGKGGNGPLIEFAALKEYAEPLKPKTVLWVFSENDLTDLKNEVNSMFLRNYLDNSYYSQNLISRQNEIDSLLKIFYQNNLEPKKSIMIRNELFKTIKLTNIRSILNITPKINPAVFKNILFRTKELVSSWGGDLYFVYVPSIYSISKSKKDPYREKILNFISEQSIPIIDIQKEVIAMHPDPLSLFPFRNAVHYNADGYRLIAEAITERLKADGIISLNSTN